MVATNHGNRSHSQLALLRAAAVMLFAGIMGFAFSGAAMAAAGQTSPDVEIEVTPRSQPLQDDDVSAKERAFAECPVAQLGVGCGFDGAVGYGDYTITYNYRKASGGYDKKIQAGNCNAPTCEIRGVAPAGNYNQAPANYEVVAPVATIYNVYAIYP